MVFWIEKKHGYLSRQTSVGAADVYKSNQEMQQLITPLQTGRETRTCCDMLRFHLSFPRGQSSFVGILSSPFWMVFEGQYHGVFPNHSRNG